MMTKRDDTTEKRGPGRPSSGQDLVSVNVMLRREQVDWLREFTSKKRLVSGMNTRSEVIRGLIDSVFAKR